MAAHLRCSSAVTALPCATCEPQAHKIVADAHLHLWDAVSAQPHCRAMWKSKVRVSNRAIHGVLVTQRTLQQDKSRSKILWRYSEQYDNATRGADHGFSKSECWQADLIRCFRAPRRPVRLLLPCRTHHWCRGPVVVASVSPANLCPVACAEVIALSGSKVPVTRRLQQEVCMAFLGTAQSLHMKGALSGAALSHTCTFRRAMRPLVAPVQAGQGLLGTVSGS